MSAELLTESVIGEGSADSDLDHEELSAIVEHALEIIKDDERVLAIIPDKTRDDNTDVLFPMASRILDQRSVKCFDALVAQGTHPPMSGEQKLSKLGLDQFTGTVFDHRWDRPEDLITLGELTAEQVTDLTAGLITKAVPVTLNKLLAPGIYDTVLVFGATVPHAQRSKSHCWNSSPWSRSQP